MQYVRSADKHNSTRIGLIAATVLLGALACAKVAHCVVASRRIAQFAAHTATQDDGDPNAAQPWLTSSREVAQTLGEKNLFVKMPPKRHPVQQVDGILGREVLIRGKWYTVGDKIGDAKVISVNSTHAVLEWRGQEKTFAPIAAINAKPGPASRSVGAKPREVEAEAPHAAIDAEAAVVTTTAEVIVEDPLAWLGVDLPSHVRAKFLERWNSVPDEQKEKIKQRWNAMSDAEKQEEIRKFEEQM